MLQVGDISESKTESKVVRKSRPSMRITRSKEASISPVRREISGRYTPPSEDGSGSPVDDLDVLHKSLKGQHSEEESPEEKTTDEVAQFHRTVQTLFEEEETLLNLHMSVIQVKYINPSFSLRITISS